MPYFFRRAVALLCRNWFGFQVGDVALPGTTSARNRSVVGVFRGSNCQRSIRRHGVLGRRSSSRAESSGPGDRNGFDGRGHDALSYEPVECTPKHRQRYRSHRLSAFALLQDACPSTTATGPLPTPLDARAASQRRCRQPELFYRFALNGF